MTDSHTSTTAGEVTLQLRKPISSLVGEVPGALVNRITLRDNTAGMWVELDKVEGIKADLTALAILARMTPRDLGQLSARDFRDACREMRTFVESAEVVVDEDETTRTLELVTPFTAPDGTEMTTLALREPLASDLDQWDKLQGVAKDLAAVRAITGLPEATVRSVGIRDFRAAASWIAHFFDDAPTAGA